MAGRRYELAEKLMRSYSPRQLLGFMFKHGRASAACQLLYPPEATQEDEPEPESSATLSLAASRSAFSYQPMTKPSEAGYAGACLYSWRRRQHKDCKDEGQVGLRCVKRLTGHPAFVSLCAESSN